MLAFEPVPGNVALLRENVLDNGLERTVEIVSKALGNRVGSVQLAAELGGAGNAWVTEGVPTREIDAHARTGRHDLARLVTCEMVRLDDYLKTSSLRCSLVKLDVEGFELEVIQGAEARIARDRPVIVGEFSERWLRSRGAMSGWIDEWAHRKAYRLFSVRKRSRRFLDRPEYNVAPLERYTPGLDIVLVPEEQVKAVP